MNDVFVTVDRWSRLACRQLYVCELHVSVHWEITGAFDFSYVEFGPLFAVVDDFGDLVPLMTRQRSWLRLYWQVEWMAIVTNAANRYVDRMWGLQD